MMSDVDVGTMKLLLDNIRSDIKEQIDGLKEELKELIAENAISVNEEKKDEGEKNDTLFFDTASFGKSLLDIFG